MHSGVFGVGPYGYSRSHRFLEWGAILAVGWLLTTLVLRAVYTLSTGDLPWLGLAALVGYLMADFLSGLVHWAADTLGTERTLFLGQNLIRPFREHHTDPKGITRHDFIETNGNSCLFALPFSTAAVAWIPAEANLLFYGCAMTGMTMFCMVLTNQFHKWAHNDTPSTFVRVLQRFSLVLARDHHDIHHTAPHRTHYCITTGWLNPILDGLRFFRVMEWCIGLVWPTLISVRRGESQSRSSSV
jgi:ubiquitin-conjugating enzyme E2 variant